MYRVRMYRIYVDVARVRWGPVFGARRKSRAQSFGISLLALHKTHVPNTAYHMSRERQRDASEFEYGNICHVNHKVQMRFVEFLSLSPLTVCRYTGTVTNTYEKRGDKRRQCYNLHITTNRF